MARSFPLHSLIKLSVTLSLVMATIVCIYIIGAGQGYMGISFRFMETLVFALLVSFGNVALLYYREKDKSSEGWGRKVAFYSISYIWSIIIGLLVRHLYTIITHHEWEGQQHPQTAYFLALISIWITNTLMLIIQGSIIVQFRKSRGELENMALKANLADASYLLLRQQIQPHFLFNALTMVKSLYKHNPEQGEVYLVHLANFLRVSLSNRSVQTVSVKEELEFCKNYIRMQSIRFGEAFKCHIEISYHSLEHKYLPYFSLQPLIENVLKHNDFTEDRPVTVGIREDNGYISVENNLQARKQKEASTGNGLYNLSERYRLLGAEEIGISTENGRFTVRLKLLDK